MEEHDIRQRLDQHRYDEALELLVERFKEKVFRLAWSMLRDPTQAEDVTQDIFVKIWKGLPGYHGGASLATWIYAIARNTCLTELKKRSAHPTLSLSGPDLENVDFPAAGHDDAYGVSPQDVETLLARLPERYRRVITLYYLEQKSYDETAAMLGLPLGTVKTLLFRGRKEMLRIGRRSEREEEPAPRGAKPPSARPAPPLAPLTCQLL